MNILIHGTGTMASILSDTIKDGKKHIVSGFADELTSETGDVIIDFGHFSRLENLLAFAVEKKIPLLIATTGYSDEILNKIEIASTKIPILLSSNTSLGINLMVKMINSITNVLYDNFDIEVVEKHHNKKLDSPSGTAKTLVEAIKKQIPYDIMEEYGREGNKQRAKNEIGIHAIRGGTVVGEHSVFYYGEDEILEIKHTALSKKIFTKGAIKSAEILVDKPIGLYHMKDII
ncbi:4-hydroxy-tetrahydrodipicolinate reductase [Fusobacterium sp. PH5-44]|uniref:4-hydroxy-tetrahydrodipicolinate reductase n=1 Tax=unclassified Fusobacterium TaxID=2648384 RepID=UPI003D23D1FE